MNSNKLRTIVAAAVFVVLSAGLIAGVSMGTLSGFGWETFSALCPLGALATMIATKTVVPRAVVSIVIAIPLGILAAIKQNTLFDHSSMVVSLIGISMPAFWLALMLMLLFSLKLGWLPAQGAKDGWKSYVLPSIAIGFMQMAAIARTTRSSMLETIRQDYIRTARSKGITEREVIFHHSFRNALIPTVTIVGVQLGGLLGGAVLTETVFAWPGLGRLVVQAVNGRDVPVVLGCIVVLSVGFSIVNLVVDLLYGFIDPRVRSMYQ